MKRRGFLGLLGTLVAAPLAWFRPKDRSAELNGFTATVHDGDPRAIFHPMIGGTYHPGDTFEIRHRSSTQLFEPRYYEVSIPEYREEFVWEPEE